ncbi:MAG TPA: hypothetical protein VH024_17530 [Candidatus Angelobacter sp.]|jgi:hypothetical protein|nr:hypothetical protein [Candidatus Angelobacter sp.]
MFSLIVASGREWALGSQNHDKVRAVIALGVDTTSLHDPDGGPLMRPIFGVIDGPMGIEGMCGLYPMQQWDSDDLYLRGFFFFVRVECRRSTHAKSLLQFGNWFSDRSEMPLVWEMLNPQHTVEKAKLFARHANLAGYLFMHQPMKQAVAA